MSILVFSFLCGAYRYKKLDDASKIFAILLGIASASEIIASIAAIKFHNNMPVYAIYSLIEFCIICLYFNNSIDVFIKKNVGVHIAFIGVLLGIANLRFIQGINTLNSYFLIFEGITIIGMALFSFFRLLIRHDMLRFTRYHHFWFAAILVFFWSVTFLNWSLYEYFNTNYKDHVSIINLSILLVNIITYISISCVFILYPKMQKDE